jgi:hypothetical protein
MNKLLLLISFVLISSLVVFGQKTQVEYVDNFANINHPQVAYWFFSKELLVNDKYLTDLDKLASESKFNMIFLTARNGLNFYDFDKMRPVFKKLVERAHSKGIKIGLQLWETKKEVAIENTERIITDGEITLDANGNGSFTAIAKHVRDTKLIIKSALFKVYIFKKTADGFYEPSSLKEITSQVSAQSTDASTVQIDIKTNSNLSGYTAYIMTQHFYNYSSNHSADAANRFVEALEAYRDIPFDGVGLDEYTNLRVSPTWDLEKNKEVFRERYYSLEMAKKFEQKFGQNIDKALFEMRYAPAGKSEIRAKAINFYMDTMREGTMNVENVVYKKAKEIYGKNTFAGLHDTHHNSLAGDEIWVTGLNWWNVPREYGHTDEGTPTPTQMGIAKTYPMNILYNMYYNKSLDNIVNKALTDLRYGIRTHYHAINDIQNWGVSVEKPEALAEINKVENCARLLNRFNPSLPETKLLVIFGMEALQNWYPNEAQRGLSDSNSKFFIEEKAKQIWDAGYRNALVPTDLISNGKLKLDADGKPILSGHKFDAVVFLYPQYAKESTLNFLENYVGNGGKLMIESVATQDFNGKDVSARFNAILAKSTVKNFSIEDVSKLGVTKNALPNGAKNEDGSFVFTDTESLKNDKTATFRIEIDGENYSGEYKGLAAILADKKYGVQKFTASGFKSLSKNGKVILSFEKPTDVYIEKQNGVTKLIIADSAKILKPLINNL